MKSLPLNRTTRNDVRINLTDSRLTRAVTTVANPRPLVIDGLTTPRKSLEWDSYHLLDADLGLALRQYLGSVAESDTDYGYSLLPSTRGSLPIKVYPLDAETVFSALPRCVGMLAQEEYNTQLDTVRRRYSDNYRPVINCIMNSDYNKAGSGDNPVDKVCNPFFAPMEGRMVLTDPDIQKWVCAHHALTLAKTTVSMRVSHYLGHAKSWGQLKTIAPDICKVIAASEIPGADSLANLKPSKLPTKHDAHRYIHDPDHMETQRAVAEYISLARMALRPFQGQADAAKGRLTPMTLGEPAVDVVKVDGTP